jgi:curved DNA-binding protein CbpA
VKSERADLYRVLQVDPSANPLVIQAAYRALAQIFHPDVSGDSEEMKRINAAWEVLGDPRRRRQYDIERAGRHAPEPPQHASAPPSAHRASPSTSSRAGANAAQPAAAAREATHAASAATRSEEHAGPPVGPASGSVIRFGRYEGWTIGQVARVDPAFLEWLRRVPLGRQLKPEIDLALQRADGAGRFGIGGRTSNDKPVHTWRPGAPTRVG